MYLLCIGQLTCTCLYVQRVCNKVLLLLSTLASRGSSRSLHSSNRAAFAVVLMGLVHVMKLFRDLRRGTTPRCPLSGCLSSVACRVRSVQLAVMFASAISDLVLLNNSITVRIHSATFLRYMPAYEVPSSL